MLDKGPAQYPHETSENDQFGIERIDDLYHLPVEGFPVGKLFMVDHVSADVLTGCALQSSGIGPVADDGLDLGIELMIFYRIDDRLQVAA